MILALAFLTIIGVLAAALIGFAFTATATTRVYREQRVVRYNAESAANLTIQKMKMSPLIGTTATPACGGTYTMREDLTAGQQQILAAGSVLTVECGPITTGSYAPVVASGGIDSDGGQAARLVAIVVRCIGPTRPANNRAVLSCTGSGPSSQVVAKVRVRFDIDYSAAPAQRAVVPKIITFDTKR